MDARLKLQEIAAKDLGGAPDDYVLGERARLPARQPVARPDLRAGGDARDRARRQVRRPRAAGRHPSDDRRSRRRALAGLGLMGVAKDTYPHDGDTYSFVVGFAEVEVDVETGKTTLVDYLAVGDVGTVDQPAQPARAAARRHQPRHRPRAAAEVGLRPALRRAARQALLPQQAADDSRHPGDDADRWRSASPIRKRRSARAASASRRSAPATAR